MAGAGRLSGAVALVTGGASGIGRAVCARLAQEGARVAVADCNEPGAADTVGSLPVVPWGPPNAGPPPPPHAAFGVDVASAPSVAQLLSSVQKHFGVPPRVCVGCAGVTRDQFLLQLDLGSFREVLEVNLLGSFLVTQAVAQALVASGTPEGGSIVHVGSIVGKVGNLGQANYAASKAGLEGLTRSCAKELARFGVRCNLVLPGMIETPMASRVPPKIRQKFAALVPMGRLGDPQEVAQVCAFLASPHSSYITGASLEVTGGLFM